MILILLNAVTLISAIFPLKKINKVDYVSKWQVCFKYVSCNDYKGYLIRFPPFNFKGLYKRSFSGMYVLKINITQKRASPCFLKESLQLNKSLFTHCETKYKFEKYKISLHHH